MGAGHSKESDDLLEAILCNQEAEVEEMLRKDNTRVNAPLLDGMLWIQFAILTFGRKILVFRNDKPNLQGWLPWKTQYGSVVEKARSRY